MLTINHYSTNLYANNYSKQTCFKSAVIPAEIKKIKYDKLYLQAEQLLKDNPKKNNAQIKSKNKPKFKERVMKFFRKLSANLSNRPQNKKIQLKADKNGWTELHYLCRNGEVNAVKTLVKKFPNLDLNQITNNGDSYVKLAIESNEEDLANFLVSRKSYNPTVKGQDGKTDLHELCKKGYTKAVKIICKKHSDIDLNQMLDSSGYSCMHNAINSGSNSRREIIKTLAGMKNYDPTKIVDENGWSDFQMLCRKGYSNAVVKLLKTHPNINPNYKLPNWNHYPIMNYVLKNCNDKTVNTIVKMENYNPESVIDSNGWTDLHYLCQSGKTKAVKTILKRFPNIDLNRASIAGTTCMKLAMNNHHTDTVNLLAEYIKLY